MTFRAQTVTGLFVAALLLAALLPAAATAGTPPASSLETAQGAPGPVPAPGIAPKVERVFLPGERAVVIPGVPGYEWRHGSGPTALGMVMGYYDGLGMDDLIPGDASTQTPEVDQAIASERSALDPGHYEDYCVPIDTASSILPDLSEPPEGDEHADDCIADFLLASRSSVPNHYGWCRAVHVADAFMSYIKSVNPDYYPRAVEYNMTLGELTWEVVTGEIDAGRPMVFLVDADGNETEDRYVTVIGYSDTTVQMYACLDTEAPADAVRWCEFATVQGGQEWGIWHGWTLEADQTLHVDAGGGEEYVNIQDALDDIYTGGRVLVHPGTYAGARNRDLEFGGKAIVVESMAGRGQTIIDCEGLGRGFNFASQENAGSVVDGFTIKDGVADFGGGIRCFWNSSPTLRNLVIDGCSATSDGGGVWSGAGSVPSLTDVTVFGCTAANRGGGLHCNAASPTLEWVTLHGNSAGSGGGVSCALNSSPVLRRTIISGSTSGGALYCAGTNTPSTSHCCVYGNAGGDALCGSYADNIFANPLYCDPYTPELTLRDDSICIPGNNPWDERVGAWGEGDCATGVTDDSGSDGVPVGRVAFHAPTPNPAVGAFDLTFTLPDRSRVTVQVYSASGKLVSVLEPLDVVGPGVHTLRWDGLDGSARPVPSGVYFFRARVGDETLTRRAVVLR